MKINKIIIDGVEYSNIDEVPGQYKRYFEDKNQDGVSDIIQGQKNKRFKILETTIKSVSVHSPQSASGESGSTANQEKLDAYGRLFPYIFNLIVIFGLRGTVRGIILSHNIKFETSTLSTIINWIFFLSLGELSYRIAVKLFKRDIKRQGLEASVLSELPFIRTFEKECYVGAIVVLVNILVFIIGFLIPAVRPFIFSIL